MEMSEARRTALLGAPGAVAVAAIAMAAGAAQKLPCAGQPRRACYSDINFLWGARDLAAHALPYVHGGIQGGHFVGHELEYPVLTGLFVWLCSLPARSAPAFIVVTMLALLPFGLVTARLLERMAGRRALYFCAAPTLVWYAFLNWDLLGVAAAVSGIYAWSRDRQWLAGGLLGVGACFKLWPGYLLLPLVLDLVCNRRYRDAAGALATAGLVALGANGPFMIANFGGWRAPFQFQTLRPADATANSLWTLVLPGAHSVGFVDRLSGAACVVVVAAVAGLAIRRFRREGRFPFVQTGAAVVAAFVALGKVHSPQYALWILPFFALLRISKGWWLVFLASDVWLFYQFSGGYFSPLRHDWAIVLSDAALLAFAVVAMRSEPAVVRTGGGARPSPDAGLQEEVPVAVPVLAPSGADLLG